MSKVLNSKTVSLLKRPNGSGGKSEKMPKAIAVAPPIPKELVPADGLNVVVAGARIVRNQWTSIGTMKYGLGLTVEALDDEYSALFTLDKPVLTGSIGRLMVDAGIPEFDENISDEDVQVFVGKTYLVRKRADKLYWYVPSSG